MNELRERKVWKKEKPERNKNVSMSVLGRMCSYELRGI
jgi:hypothetical protein